MKNPCGRDCPDRNEHCHGSCPKYAEFWNACEEIRNRRAEENRKKDMREGLRKSMVQKAARIRQWRDK